MEKGFQWPQTDEELAEYQRRARQVVTQMYLDARAAGDTAQMETILRGAPLGFMTRKELEALPDE